MRNPRRHVTHTSAWLCSILIPQLASFSISKPLQSPTVSAAPRTINAYAAFESRGLVKPWQFESRPFGAEDVAIKISHCGICSMDVHTIDNDWRPIAFSCVVGHEIVGEVTLVGSEVAHLAVGDRVGVGAQVFTCLNKDKTKYCVECTDSADTYCSRTLWSYSSQYDDGHLTRGGYADYIRVLSHYAFRILEVIPPDAAAPLLCAGVTVFMPLEQGGIKAGGRVGVVGIGGLGHLAVQFIRALGAIPVAFSRSFSKEKDIRTLGAQEFYNLSDPESAKQAVASVNMLLITADAINMPYNTYLDLLRPRGACVVLAVPNDEVKYLPFFLVSHGIKFVGSGIGSIVNVKDMLKLAAEKNVRPIIQKMPMAEVNKGLQMVCDGTVRYRVVLEN